MAKPKHLISDINPAGKTATCAICGPGAQVGSSAAPDRPTGRRWYCLATKRTSADARHGLTYFERQAMIEAAGGRCPICGTTKPSGHGWAIDHDHVTGAIRGVLCSRCNLGIGHFNDDANLLLAAVAYLNSATPLARNNRYKVNLSDQRLNTL